MVVGGGGFSPGQGWVVGVQTEVFLEFSGGGGPRQAPPEAPRRLGGEKFLGKNGGDLMKIQCFGVPLAALCMPSGERF